MILNLDDYEIAARRHLPRPLFQYIAGAAETSAAFDDNRAALNELKLVPRVLCGVEGRAIRQRLLGEEWAAPFGIAPMGISALMAFDGDNVAARVANREGIPYVLSGSSLTCMEEIIEANPRAWFQAYVPGEEDRIAALIERVTRAGYQTLVLTADTAVLANRENNLRAGFSTPLRFTPRMLWDFGIKPRWLFTTFLQTLLRRGMPHFENSYAHRGAPIISRQAARDFGRKDHLNWDHVRRIRNQWKGNLIVKGVLSHLDVALARDIGCDGVVLSNHGGRQLDHAISAIRALPQARVEAGHMVIMVDGGIRRGTDVVKALALGADFVFIGRPFLYASTIGGERSLSKAVRIMKNEVHRDLGLLGLRSTGDISSSSILHSN
ncbi:alpha-hydroxy acid oxidase [Kushneria konosiri]|uniref:Alpha-hydroxy-acid oxidizing enzyme n=1 Tax=Kushneria konosiri TaxID=698828 RepID=A0A2Z2H8S7_9GAMM|nr:alpha-hydroxy acid oxidase [Kushneria konosiri]ARS53754.1 alpha-hydroxy-acid oxidizing enzyme [Kushneria konosiri]